MLILGDIETKLETRVYKFVNLYKIFCLLIRRECTLYDRVLFCAIYFITLSNVTLFDILQILQITGLTVQILGVPSWHDSTLNLRKSGNGFLQMTEKTYIGVK